jgi:hypothetical protein
MTQTIDINQQRLTLLSEYRQYLTSLFTEEEADGNAVLLVLIAFEMTLKRRVDKTLPTVEWNNCMRWAVAESNRLLDVIYDVEFDAVDNWNPATDKPVNGQQALAATLMTLVHELNGDIGESEDYLKNELKMSAEDYAREIITAYEAEVGAGDA